MQAHELPPPAQMILLLGGFRVSQALYAAAALGVADHLVAGPAAAEVLAERTGAHPPSLRRLLRTLAGVGVFTEPEPGVFALTPLGRTLASGQPGSMRDVVIMFMETHYAPFGDLLGTIRTGQPAAERFYGQPFFAWLSQHPEQASRFTAAMASLTGGFKGAAIAALPLDGTGTIIDVGGADGTMLAAILAAHPHMHGDFSRRWSSRAGAMLEAGRQGRHRRRYACCLALLHQAPPPRGTRLSTWSVSLPLPFPNSTSVPSPPMLR